MKQQFRLKADSYFIVGVWEFCGVLTSATAFSMRHPGDFWPMQVLALLMFHLPSLLGVWCIERARIFVDERGIRFREAFKTRFVAWDEIEDFAWELPSDGNKSRQWRAALWIGGKKKRLSETIKNREHLCELIARRATNTPAREWALVCTRDCDTWPRTFVYHDTPNWQIAALFFAVAGLMLARITMGAWGKGWEPMATNIALTWEGLEWWGRIAFVGICTFSIFAMPTLILAASCAGLKTKRRFLEQHIVVTREGLEQWNGPSRRLCTWGDIERFELERVPGSLQLPLCVVWARGQRFDWHSGISDGRLLRIIVEQRALNARGSAWTYRSGNDEDLLGGENSLWPSGVVGVGPKRYHYRTRTNRAGLVLGWVMAVPLVFIFAQPVPSQSNVVGEFVARTLLVLLFAPVLLLSVGGLCAYFSSWLERDDEGLNHRSLFGRRSLRWDEITRVRWNGCVLQIRSPQMTIRVGPVTDYERLLSDIEAHGLTIEKPTNAQKQSTPLPPIEQR